MRSTFEAAGIDALPTHVIEQLFYSIKNLRINSKLIDPSRTELRHIGVQMRKASYLAEIEFRYVYVLHNSDLPVKEGSQYLSLIIEYFDHYFDKSDVTNDLRIYLSVLETPDREYLWKQI